MWHIPVRFLVMWAPLAAVTIGGAVYVYECADTFLTPGTGFAMDYTTPGGTLHIECASYSIDLVQQTVYAKKLVIKKEDGTLVAKVPMLVAKGIAVDEGLSPKVQVRDAELWVTRDAKGDIDILKYFAPSQPTGEKKSWQVSVRDTKFHFRDETVPGGVRNELDINSGNIVGLGDNIEGGFNVEALGLAKGQVNFHKEPGLTLITSNGIDGKIEPILRRLRAGQERKLLESIQELKVTDGTFRGDFHMEIREKKPLLFRSQISAQAPSVTWQKYTSDHIDFRGVVTENGLDGRLLAGYKGAKVDADGVLSYGPKVDFGGNIKASGVTPATLASLNIKLPKEVSFQDAKTSGALTYRDRVVGWSGPAIITKPQGFGLKAPVIEADIGLQNQQLIAKVKPVAIGNTVVSANVGYNLKSQAIVGTLSTPDAHGGDFAQWLPKELQGSHGQVAAVIDGTIQKPDILVKSSIDPKIKLSDRTLEFNKADLVLRFDGQKFHLDRATINDPSGSFVATGDIDFKKGINVKVVANSVDLEKLVSNTSGLVDLQAQITGTLAKPKYVGRAQGFGVTYEGLPGKVLAVASNFAGDQDSLRLTQIEAMKGASQITGNLGIGLSNQTLSGLFAVKGIDVRDLYDGPVGGVLDLNDITVAGTMTNPLVQGSFDAKKILAYNYAIDSASGFVNYDGEKFHLSRGMASFAKGTISDITGDISAKTRSGKLLGNFSKIDLNDVTQSALQPVQENDGGSKHPAISSQIAIKGSSSGNFDVGITNGAFTSFMSKGRVDDVLLNKAFIGSGEWDAGFDGQAWSLNAFIGSLDDYFRIDNGTYKPETKEIGGEFLSYKVPIEDVLLAAEPSLNLSAENLDKLHLFKGKLGSVMQFSGTTSNLTVEIPEFEVSSIKLGDTELGNFSVTGTYANKDLTLKNGLLVGPKTTKVPIPLIGIIKVPEDLAVPNGTAKLDGTIKDSGEIDLTGSLFGFPVSKFQAIAPALSNVNLFVDRASFHAVGTREKPNLTGDIQATAGFTPDGRGVQMGILASKLKIKSDFSAKPGGNGEDDAILVASNGTFSFNSIDGNYNGSLFLGKDFTPKDSSKVQAHVALDGPRDLLPFFHQFDGLTLGKQGANLSGAIDISNTYREPLISGNLNLVADSIQYVQEQPLIGRPIDLALQDIQSSIIFEPDTKNKKNVAHFKTNLGSNYSARDPKDATLGTVAIDAKVPFDIWDHRPLDIVNGTVTANRFGIYQSFPQGAYVRGIIDTAQAPIKIEGPIDKPKISGNIYFDGVKTILPTLNPKTSSDQPSNFDPTFDLKFFSESPMNIKSSVAELNVDGKGSLRGSLSNIKADGSLTVESGSLNLPGGILKLSQDGSIDLRYENTAFNNKAQLLANLHGETSLTALKNGISPERYDIFVDIKGDLLSSTEALQLTATSQPGDLTQDRILQLLGRTDLLTNILQSGVNSSIQSELKDAFVGYAIPSLLSGVTTDIAKSFGLDYFGVDYNAFEQASLSFVKNLGAGFYLQGRRQLFQPLPGEPLAYDFRIAYRPRRGPDSLRALSFSFGTDQLRPYKLSIDYSTRVGKRKPPYQTAKLHVPNK